MKILLLILLTYISLLAKSDATCFTVQLLSKENTQENREEFAQNSFPQSCKTMQIGNSLTVRCGCYDTKENALHTLPMLQKSYEQAMVITTYKYRFEDEIKKEIITPVENEILKPIKKIKKEAKKKQKETQQNLQVMKLDEKPTCYTVQLISLSKNRNSLEKLSNTSYPSSCKLMEIGETYTVRCGCYTSRDETTNEYNKLQKIYQNASIARTYKYRFEDTQDSVISQNSKENHPEKKEKIKVVKQDTMKQQSKKMLYYSKKDEELRLILQVFLYKSDLENAYKVASIGYKSAPNSYYWNQKMAEITQWTGRTEESMMHLRNLYNLRYDEKIEKELIDFGIASYRYEDIEDLVVNKAKSNPTEKNIDLMIFVYKQIGEPEKVVDVLESEYNRRKKSIYLTKALALSLEMGDLQRAQKYVTLIESKKPYSQRDAALISNFYYVEHKIEKSYQSLNYVDKLNITDKDNYVKYFELKSDLGWYLQDNANAALASQELMRLKRARLVDYERISYVYKDKDPELAGEAAKQAYLKYRLSYLFYSYANNALNRKQYGELKDLMDTIEKNNYPLVDEALYWVMKSKMLYGYYKDRSLEEKALLKALSLKNNYEIKLILLTHYINSDENKKLRAVLADIESSKVESSYYFPLASAYYHLKDIDRASFYMQKLEYEKNPVTRLLEFRFMQAYIYQIQNNEEAFMSAMRSIVSDLEKQAKENSALKEDEVFLSNYLRAAIYVFSPEKFAKKLKNAKPYLSKKDYREISYSFATMNKADEKSQKIYNKIKQKDLWLRFSNALMFQRHSEIEDLLERHLDSLSPGDASQAAYKDGQKALAQTIAFNILLRNDKNQNAYIQHMDLSKERSDLFEAKASYNDRDPLLQKELKVNNKLYIRDGYYFDSGVSYALNTSLAKSVLTNLPEDTLYANVGVKKLFNRTYVSADLLYTNAIESYFGFAFEVNHRLSTDLLADIKVKKNAQAEESTLLLLGGKKDLLNLNLIWSILTSTAINLTYEKNFYRSQDNIEIGDSNYYKLLVTQQIRNSYPDMRIGIFYDRFISNEKDGFKGSIDNIQVNRYNVLEPDFYNVGLNLSYGMANSNIYTRVWRPYIELTPAYNSVTDDYSYGFNIGAGGKVYSQDHLAIGFSYNVAQGGAADESYLFYLNYQFLYVHPKF